MLLGGERGRTPEDVNDTDQRYISRIPLMADNYKLHERTLTEPETSLHDGTCDSTTANENTFPQR